MLGKAFAFSLQEIFALSPLTLKRETYWKHCRHPVVALVGAIVGFWYEITHMLQRTIGSKHLEQENMEILLDRPPSLVVMMVAVKIKAPTPRRIWTVCRDKQMDAFPLIFTETKSEN